jgi:hypothetical protein
VSNVLCALKHTEREAGQEVAGRQQTGGRAEGEAGMP